MEKHIYIKFEAPDVAQLAKANRGVGKRLERFVATLLSTVLPKANPDFDHKIGDVKYWLVELDIATGIPQREIGLDKNAQVLLKMPFEDNNGYWTDNNLILTDFEACFNTSKIDKIAFIKYWEAFSSNSPCQ